MTNEEEKLWRELQKLRKDYYDLQKKVYLLEDTVLYNSESKEDPYKKYPINTEEPT